jgi:tetraacyldisaccharide-1-P 4'-kinase
VLTTEKDCVRLGKLGASIPLKTARLRIEIENEEEAVKGLMKILGL